ncbi:MAG: VIT1/CCC1 transporter family protein, partial [Nanoarchaeota archaeon]|nr:VIT1/CCC1 transporter family protein [Nanoarchaeota archaeon]
DGSITTFAVVAGVIGASLNSSIVLILGFANLFADGFSMSVANYMSTKSRNEMLKTPEKDERKTAFATFISFFSVGFIPLISFVVAAVTKNSWLIANQFKGAFVLTGLSLLVIGWLKGVVTEKHRIKSAIQTFLIGGGAALLAFSAGKFISGIVG